ncbi:exodeoxyribonuclease V subunit alpha, partial [Ectothiorhodospiraceae bacterium WFHF3C12]|nr:exodeoxyribonuclease V subunit alpha [Ectothiorhodospiraceae bacterium WFHF3C12]
LDDEAPPALPGEAAFCSTADLHQALTESALVGEPGASRPLVLDGERLYLHRYWQYEARLAARLRELIATPPAAVDTTPLQRGGALFDYDWVGDGETHWQAVAAATALRQRFTVISGGPGTGKTYTVLRLVKLLMDDALARQAPEPAIALAAPTGKAAARMMESMRAGLAELPDGEALRPRLPEDAATLHRLLGLRGDTTRPRHDRDNPLTADVVIVDEASMVDLPMMAKLADAIPGHGRLILLGDRYQLASVESGAVLAELCRAAGVNAFSAQQRAAFGPLLQAGVEAGEPLPPLADHVVTLQTSHRFTADSAIGRLAAAVNAGDAGGAMSVLGDGDGAIEARLDDDGAIDDLVETLARAHAPLVSAADPDGALEDLSKVQLLTATRVGPAGSDTLNHRVHEAVCRRAGLDPAEHWYPGRPIIVQHNDYRAGLFNGDIGICLADEAGRLRVWFRTTEGLRAYLPTALPQHDSVYAMTVHKSQGSEFDHVHLLLPDVESPVVTRELLYTGITRARSALTVYGASEALRAAIGRRVHRHSGLAARLAG